MVSAPKFVSEDGKQQIAAAIADAEKQTAAEIVCVVATESGRYDRAEAVVGIVVAVVALWFAHMVGQSWVLGQWDVGGLHLAWQVLAVVVGFVPGNTFLPGCCGWTTMVVSGDPTVVSFNDFLFGNLNGIPAGLGGTGLLNMGTLWIDVQSAIGDQALLQLRNGVNSFVDAGPDGISQIPTVAILTFVPEPSVAVLLGLSLVGLAAARRREA